MNFIQKIGTAVAASTIAFTGVIAPQQAQAGCWPSLAASTIADMVSAGAPVELAVQAAVNDGHYEANNVCYYKTIGYMKKYPSIYGWFTNQLWGLGRLTPALVFNVLSYKFMTDLDRFLARYRHMRDALADDPMNGLIPLSEFIGLCEAYINYDLEMGRDPDPDDIWACEYAASRDKQDPDWLDKLEVTASAG